MDTAELFSIIFGSLGFLLSATLAIREYIRSRIRISVVRADGHFLSGNSCMVYVLRLTVLNRSSRVIPLASTEVLSDKQKVSEGLVCALDIEPDTLFHGCPQSSVRYFRSLLHGCMSLPANLPAHCLSRIALVFCSQSAHPVLDAHCVAAQKRSTDTENMGQRISAQGRTKSSFSTTPKAPHLRLVLRLSFGQRSRSYPVSVEVVE